MFLHNLLLSLNVKSHLHFPPCSFTLLHPLTPHIYLGNSGGSGHFLSTPSAQATHLYWSLQERHLLFNPFANKIHWIWEIPWQRKLEARAPYTHWIYHWEASAEGHWEHAFHIAQRWEGRKCGVAPAGRPLRYNDTPGSPLSRCSANQNSSGPGGVTGKIPHLPHWNQATHNLNPQGTPGSRNGLSRAWKCSSLKHRLRGNPYCYHAIS